MFSQPSDFFFERRLKKSLRCDLVVATLTMRQFLRMNSWISALIQCTAKLIRRTPTSGSKRLTAFIRRSEEHTSELQSLMRISYAVFCLKKKKKPKHIH